MLSEDEVIRSSGVETTRCNNTDALLGQVAGDKLKLSSFSKDELDAALTDAAKDGWRVVLRSHCSETGRHGAKLWRPLPRAGERR